MMDMTLERFIFINACSADEERIAPILRVLQDNGARMSTPLKECETALAFVSGAALESHDWRKEFNTLLLEQKPVTVVLLEAVEVSPIMKQQMESMTVISFADCRTPGAFCVKILQIPEVKQCLEEEKTVKIPKNFAKKYYLKRKNTSEEIYISKTGFTIGRKAICDYVIEDNVTISRVHAIFELENGICTVCDHHSTNGVYVNDTELGADEKYPIKSGDVIEIGNEKFIAEVLE